MLIKVVSMEAGSNICEYRIWKSSRSYSGAVKFIQASVERSVKHGIEIISRLNSIIDKIDTVNVKRKFQYNENVKDSQ